MKIEKNVVVEIDYKLTDDGGATIDSSEGDEPLVYMHGHQQIVPGLEKALDGRAAGESVKVAVPPKDGYGEKEPGKDITVSRKQLPPSPAPEVGMGLVGQAPDGAPMELWVAEVKGDQVTLTANHPLAGMTLHFDVTIKSVRKATADELSHGHVHGPDGHHHH